MRRYRITRFQNKVKCASSGIFCSAEKTKLIRKRREFVANILKKMILSLIIGIVLKTARIKENAVPSLLLPLQNDEEVTSPRDLRIQNRHLIPSVLLIVQDKENIELEVPAENLLLPNQRDCSTQTETSKVDCGAQVKQLMVNCSTQTDEIIPTYSQLLEQIAKLKAENWKKKKTSTK